MLTETSNNQKCQLKHFLVGFGFCLFSKVHFKACDVVIDVILDKEPILSAMAYTSVRLCFDNLDYF